MRVRRLAHRGAELLRINEALRESEERYAVAAQGANDGLWDWNLKTDQVYYSPRWTSMLGYAEHEVEATPAAWLKRIHPDDAARVEADLDAHLEGVSRRFPVDALKIDRSFVRGMDARAEDLAIVRAIVTLALTPRIGTVAEGVETPEQAVNLMDLGCQLGQGHLFAPPMEREQAVALVAPAP